MQISPHRQGGVASSVGDFGSVPQNQADCGLSSSLNFYSHSYSESHKQNRLENDVFVQQGETSMQYMDSGEQDSNAGASSIPISASLARKRAIAGSGGGWAGSGSYGSADYEYMESLRIRDEGVVEEPSTKMQRNLDTYLPDFANMGSPDEGMFAMDADFASAASINEEEDRKGSKVSSKVDTSRAVEEADRGIFEACFNSDIRWLADPALEKMSGLEIGWVKPPAKKVRPSYNCEGSRGSIKTEDGASVEINVNLTTPLVGTRVAVLIAACVTEGKGQVVTAHPHFKTSCVGEQSFVEQEIDGLSAICIKKEISSPRTKIKMEVGIKRSTKGPDRTPKLNRKARVIYRLCLVEKEFVQGDEYYWRSAEWAQIITSTISLEQSQGPPTITDLSITKCTADGNVTVAAKGKNLESKADNKVMVVFSHKQSGWQTEARVFHHVTTAQSLAFVVPSFRPPRGPWCNSSKVEVTIVVTVDGRRSDNECTFTYVLPKQRSVPTQQNMQPPADFDRLLNIAEVESVLSNIEGGSNSVHQVDIGQTAVDSQQFYELPQLGQFGNGWTKQEPEASSCVGTFATGKLEPAEWTQQETSMNDHVHGLSLNDRSWPTL